MSRIVLVVLALVLAACQSAPAAPVTPQPPLKVAVSPSLTWLEGDLAACAASEGIAVQRADDDPAASGVIALQLGAPQDGRFAAVLGQEKVVVIVHPDNPQPELTRDDALAIFSGRQKSWPDGTEILVWGLPETSDAHTAMLTAGFSFAGAGLAASPQAMLHAVASDPAAIGYLPARWVDVSVRALEITGMPVEAPILAVSAQEPQGGARALLVCLQEKIGR